MLFPTYILLILSMFCVSMHAVQYSEKYLQSLNQGQLTDIGERSKSRSDANNVRQQFEDAGIEHKFPGLILKIFGVAGAGAGSGKGQGAGNGSGSGDGQGLSSGGSNASKGTELGASNKTGKGTGFESSAGIDIAKKVTNQDLVTMTRKQLEDLVNQAKKQGENIGRLQQQFVEAGIAQKFPDLMPLLFGEGKEALITIEYLNSLNHAQLEDFVKTAIERGQDIKNIQASLKAAHIDATFPDVFAKFFDERSISIDYLNSLSRSQLEDLVHLVKEHGGDINQLREKFEKAHIESRFPGLIPQAFGAGGLAIGEGAGKGSGLGAGEGPGEGAGKGPGLGFGEGAGKGPGLGEAQGTGKSSGQDIGVGGQQEKSQEIQLEIKKQEESKIIEPEKKSENIVEEHKEVVPPVEEPIEQKPIVNPVEKPEEKPHEIKNEPMLADEVLVSNIVNPSIEQQKISDEILASVLKELSYKLFEKAGSAGEGAFKKEFKTIIETYLYYLKYQLIKEVGKNESYLKGAALKDILAHQHGALSKIDQFVVDNVLKPEHLSLDDFLMNRYNDITQSGYSVEAFKKLLEHCFFDAGVVSRITTILETIIINALVQQRMVSPNIFIHEQVISDARVVDALKKLKKNIDQDPLMIEYNKKNEEFPNIKQAYDNLEKIYMQGIHLDDEVTTLANFAHQVTDDYLQVRHQATLLIEQGNDSLVDKNRLEEFLHKAEFAEKKYQAALAESEKLLETYKIEFVKYLNFIGAESDEIEHGQRLQHFEKPYQPTKSELSVDSYLQQDYLALFAHEINQLRVHPEFYKYQGLLGSQHTEAGGSVFGAVSKIPLLNLLQGSLPPRSLAEKIRNSLLFNPDAFDKVFEEGSVALSKVEKTHNKFISQAKQITKVEVDPAELIVQGVAKAGTIGRLIDLVVDVKLMNALPENKKSILKEIKHMLMSPEDNGPDNTAVLEKFAQVRKQDFAELDVGVAERIDTILNEYKAFKKILIEARDEHRTTNAYVGTFLADALRPLKFTTDKSLNSKKDRMYMLDRMPKAVYEDLQRIVGNAALFTSIIGVKAEKFYTWIEPYGLLIGLLKSFLLEVKRESPAADQIALLINSFKAINNGQKGKDAVLSFIEVNESAVKLGKGLFGDIISALENFDLKKARDLMIEFMNKMGAKDKEGKLWSTLKACKDVINNALDKLMYPMIKLLIEQIKDIDAAKGTVEIPGISVSTGEQNARVYQQLKGLLKPWLDALPIGSEKIDSMDAKQLQTFIQQIPTIRLVVAINTIDENLQNNLKNIKVTGFDTAPIKHYLNEVAARIARVIDYGATKVGMIPTGLIPPPPGMDNMLPPPPPMMEGNQQVPPPPPPLPKIGKRMKKRASSGLKRIKA